MGHTKEAAAGMEQHGLITTLVAAIVLAFVFGFVASRLRLSPIVGYLVAGFVVGPYSPGFTADVELALQLSEIGVILLMFGVGLKISVEDIWSVRWIAVPGSLLQTVLIAVMGAAVGLAFGQTLAEAALVGIAISVASTVVFLRVLEDRRVMKTEQGRISVSWLLVEDFVIILAIVVLPALVSAMAANAADVSPLAIASAVGLTLAKIAGFVALMLVVGGRFFPWLIVQIAHTKSRELLSLGTLALALGVAAAAFFWFDASFALGAFLGGLALNGSKFSHRVAEDSLPLRDTFAVLFFVAVGMLLDPGIFLRQPLALGTLVLVIVAGKAALAYFPLRWMGQDQSTSLLVALGTAQIGEFSFVLADLGRRFEVMTMETYNLILGAAMISIAINPFLMRLVPEPPHDAKPEPAPAAASA
jgi:monovalent cation:H+ antiporter-2, CPA2 family